MPDFTFINYYQMVGILQTDDRITARSKVKAALIFTHPDKHSVELKNEYTEKSAILSAALEIFSDEKILKSWKLDHSDKIWKWFRKPASQNNKPENSIVPAEYLQWLADDAVWYELRHISSWRSAARTKATSRAEERPRQDGPQGASSKQSRTYKEDNPRYAREHPEARDKPPKAKEKSEKLNKKEQKTRNSQTFSTRQYPKSRTDQQSPEDQKPKFYHRRPPQTTSRTEEDSNFQVPRNAAYIVINDDDQTDGPASRTRSKTTKREAWSASYGTAHEAQYANIPSYRSPNRKRKRNATDAGVDDIFVASLLAERVRTPY